MLRSSVFNISIDIENKEIPLYRQVTDKIIDMIKTGILRPGDVLPGTRELAINLNVSRKTTLRAMELLTADGWLVIKDRVGVFVAGSDDNNKPVKGVEQNVGNGVTLEVDAGLPDTKLLPYADYGRMYRQTFILTSKWQQTNIIDPQGYDKLRAILAESMCHERGVNINKDEMMITRGSQQALYLIAHTLLNPGDVVAMENPCYERARMTFEAAGLKVVQIEVDDDGISIDRLRPILEAVPVKAVYVTPRYQYPTCVTLSNARRRALAELIRQHDLLLIEDDFGSMFKFRGAHLLPLAHIVDKKHFVYVGTFSKMFSPTIRLGYVASNEEFIKKMVREREMMDLQGDRIGEKVFFDLIDTGIMRRHMRSTSRIYSERLKRFCAMVDEKLAGKVIYKKPNGGLTVWLRLTKRTTKEQLENDLLSRGVKVPVFVLNNGHVGMRIGYASLSEKNMEFLLNVLKSVL